MSHSSEDYNAGGLAGEIIGLHLDCPKGLWQVGGEKIETGFHFTFFAPTAMWGRILWVDSWPVDKVLHKYSDGWPIYEELPPGWSHHTMAYGASADGQLVTFTSAYGARKTFKNVIQQYLARGKRAFPVCALSTRPRNDQYGNIDPVLNIMDWLNASSFADTFPGIVEASKLAPPTAPVEAPRKLMTVTSGRSDAPIGSIPDGYAGPDSLDDSIPF